MDASGSVRLTYFPLGAAYLKGAIYPMTGAMYAAISGMKTHMNKLNVIGNNIANVNTFGFKAGRTTFQESIYTSMRSGSNGTNLVGGNNPAQIGYGTKIGTIDLNMGTGQYVPTGSPLDCMISGDGFFMVGPKPGSVTGDDGTVLNVTNAKDLTLTRVGNFSIDSDGYLVDGNNQVVYGFVTCATVDGAAAGEPGLADKDNPQVSTQLVPIRMPLAAKTPEDPDTDPPAGTPIFPGIGEDDGQNIYDAGGDDGLSTGKHVIMESINIDKNGKITGEGPVGGSFVLGYIALAKVANPNGVTHTQGPYYKAGGGAGDVEVVSVGGILDGKYLNNVSVDDADDTSIPILAAAKTEIYSNMLEGSNTDVATEFSEMITTQRGYQANTRIITVTDAMLEELVNIKR